MSGNKFEVRRPWTTQVHDSPGDHRKAMFACESCGREFGLVDQVVVTAHRVELIATAAQRDSTQPRPALFHLAHWNDQPGYRWMGGGRFGDVVR